MQIEEKYYKMVFDKPLTKQLWKHMEEQWAQLILVYYNEEYKCLNPSDKPDLQSVDKSLGIEVTNIKSESEGYIDGNFATYVDPRANRIKRTKSLQNLNQYGIQIKFPGVMTKSGMSDDERIQNVINAYKKKIGKISDYRNFGFKKIGLFLFNENPPINPNHNKLRLKLKETFKEHDFDIIFLNAANRLMVLDENKEIIDLITINKDDYIAMSCKARDIVENNEKQ